MHRMPMYRIKYSLKYIIFNRTPTFPYIMRVLQILNVIMTQEKYNNFMIKSNIVTLITVTQKKILITLLGGVIIIVLLKITPLEGFIVLI